MTLAAAAFEWDLLARILGLAAAAGLDLPILLVLPWLFSLLPGVAPPLPGVLGGLDSPAPAMLGFALLAGWLLARRLPVAGTVLTLLLAGSGVIVAALLPWVLDPGGGGSVRILESLAAIVVSGSMAAVRTGWRFVHAHDPATLPGSELIRRRGWLLSGVAGTLVVGALVAPGAAGLASIGLLSLALWPGRGALRAFTFALGIVFQPRGWAGHRHGHAREDAQGHGQGRGQGHGQGHGHAPPAWALEGVETETIGGTPAALLGYGGGGLRPGWLIEGIEGDGSLCFRYRTPMGAWDLDLSGADTEETEPGPLVDVRSIVRGGARYVLLLPPGASSPSIHSTDPVQRNL